MNNMNYEARKNYAEMPKNVKQDCLKSNEAFVRLVWPVISEVCGGGVIRPIETFDGLVSRDLDILAGIDVLQIIDGLGCRGIASRVQFSDPKFGDKDWQTFTIRESRIGSTGETELEKRFRAVNGMRGIIAPYLTVQSYISVDGSRLVGCGVARTVDIFRAIEMGLFTRNSYDNANFIVVKYQDVDGVWSFA